MRLLLDTHVVVWMLYGPDRISDRARLMLENGDNTLIVSVASPWEAAIKKANGKWGWLPDSFPSDIRQAGLDMMPVTERHAWRVRELAMLHRDPFDRLLIACALEEDLTLVTDDRMMEGYGARVIRG